MLEQIELGNSEPVPLPEAELTALLPVADSEILERELNPDDPEIQDDSAPNDGEVSVPEPMSGMSAGPHN